MISSYKFKIIRDIPDLQELRHQWNELAPPREVEPWQQFDWTLSAAMAYSRKHHLRVITIKKDGKLTAVAPLVLKPSEQPLSPWRIDFLGGEEIKEPNRLIGTDPVSLDLLTDVMASKCDYPLRLSRMYNRDGALRLLETKIKRAPWVTKQLRMPYPYLDLSQLHLRKSLREDLRRARRKADKFGEVTFEIVCDGDLEHLLTHLKRAFRIESSGWKGVNQSAILSSESRKAFFELYACSALKEGTLRLVFMMINEEPVAAQYAIESANDYWLLNIGYDETYRKCSPGLLLLEYSIQYAQKKGLSRYNLLGKEETWTKRWTSATEETIVLAAYQTNFRGFRAMLSDALYLQQKRRRRFNSKRY